jgi:hypothetical protein
MLKIKHINTDIYLKSILNVLTEAYDYVKLTEAVPYSVAKEYLEIERSPEAEVRIKEIFSKLKSLPNARQLDKRGWRIAFPYSEDSTEFEIQSILEPYNFSIKDYKDGLALDTKNNREIKIGRALDIVSKKEPDAKELIDRYAAIKGKGATNKDEDLMMVFSSAKYDLAGMSTGREWRSCMNVIDGMNKKYVKVDIKEGSIICYLTTVSDTNLEKALGRVLIKPFINTEDKKDVVLYTEFKTYGKISNSEKFIDIVDDYMEKTQKLSGKYKRLGCLYTDSQRGEIEGKETIRTRVLKKLEDGEGLSKEEFISLPLKNKRQYIDKIIKEEVRLLDFQYSFASQSQKKEYIKMILDKTKFVNDFEYKGAPKDFKVYIKNYIVDNGLDLPGYIFDDITPEQVEKHIDIRLSKGGMLRDFQFQIATKEQKEKYIDWKLSEEQGLDYQEIKAATKEQKEKYIDSKLRDAHRLFFYEFESATQKQKEKYIDWTINRGHTLNDEEIKAATLEQKEKYIDFRLSQERGLDDHELEVATEEQKEKYIDWILSKGFTLIYNQFEALTPKQKEKYIDWLLSKERYMFSDWEFEGATKEQKEKYIDWKLSEKAMIYNYQLKAATPEQKEKYYAYAK